MKSNTIYLDAQASTPVDLDVLNCMIPYFTEYYGNGNHKMGWKSNSAIENSRFQVANLICAKPTEITFTSGATESINIALLGLAKANKSSRNHIITQKTEHTAVLACVAQLKQQGYRVSYLDVDSVGRIDLNQLKNSMSRETLLVAIMFANNEIGTVQPIEEIGKICKKYEAKFFCDLTQGLGWDIINVNKLNIDLAAFSSHKIYGPRGVGGLYIKKMIPKTNIHPIIFGGGQEKHLRPGTINLPGVVGFGLACELLKSDTKNNVSHLRDQLQTLLTTAIKGIKINGCTKNRHPGNLNLSIPMVTGEDLIGALPHIIFSTSSACSSGANKPSHVISELKVSNEVLHSSFRFGLSKYNTTEEITLVANQLIKTVNKLQQKRK